MILPKLLGSYEEELHAEIESLLSRDYTDVVDIGCGEGYYAVGLALRSPRSHVHAYDIDPVALRATVDLARLNNVSERVTVAEGYAEQLRNLVVNTRVLLVSDCEGAEVDLLYPETLPRAASVDLLVDFAVPVRRRFVRQCRISPALRRFTRPSDHHKPAA